MAFYKALISSIGRLASAVRQELYFPVLGLIAGLLGASVCCGFTIFNPVDNTYELTLKNPEGDDIAHLEVASHTVHKVPEFDGQRYDALTVTYQQKSSWVQSLLRPFSFLWGAGGKASELQTVALKAASYEPVQTIAADSSLIMTDKAPKLAGRQLSKVLAVKMYNKRQKKA